MSERTPIPAQRRRLILEMLCEHGSVTVDQVQKRFGVSLMTARRDLATLSETGYLRRTHGGAVVPDFVAGGQPFRSCVEQHVPAKLRLAAAVAASLEPRETVFLDSSSSSYYIVRQLLESALLSIRQATSRTDGASGHGCTVTSATTAGTPL